MRVNAVIVAAGEGKRMGKEIPKPFLPVGGCPLILHTLSRFAASKTVHKVVLVTAEKELPRCRDLLRTEAELAGLACVLHPGGLTRQDSVSRGLGRLDADCEIVVVHDGARPFISPALIDRCVDLAFKKGAVVVGVPVRDTIKVISKNRHVQDTPSRDSLWEVQTPQVFRVEIIREAYEKVTRMGKEATDDATLVERLGKKVILLQGHRTNLKITFPEDLLIAEALFKEWRFSKTAL
ncbi:MAG: 2-C-methyl-D-erythritol 4-phosphate cytidylyltransferase [Candidatus Binatia bacterium]